MVHFEVLVSPRSYLKLLRRGGLWPILHSNTILVSLFKNSTQRSNNVPCHYFIRSTMRSLWFSVIDGGCVVIKFVSCRVNHNHCKGPLLLMCTPSLQNVYYLDNLFFDHISTKINSTPINFCVLMDLFYSSHIDLK